jgi:type II secretory pathway component PulJ
MLDTLVAIVISTVILVGTYSIVSQTSDVANAARQNNAASAAARQIMENMRQYRAARIANGTYDSILGGTNPDLVTFGAMTQLDQLNQNGITTGATAVVAPVTGRNGLKQITVTVQWRAGGNSRLRSRVFTTFITKGGLVP